MSRRVRNRVTATVLGGLLLGAGLLTGGTADAAQVAGGGHQVIFAGGGMFGLTCRSTPSVESLSVPAESTVRVVNRTGRGARLLLNGESRGSVADDGSTQVVIRPGTTAVTLDPDCTVGGQATPVLVTATPRISGRADPVPLPTRTDFGPDEVPVGPDDIDVTDGPDDGIIPDFPLPTRTAPRPHRSPTFNPPWPAPVRPRITHAPRAATRTATKAARPGPHGGGAHRVKTRATARGTARAAAPATTALPPRVKTVLPGVPRPARPTTPAATAPVLAAGPTTQIVAAEPVAAMRPLPDSQPLGLLTLIASVSVLGVSIGLIRAIVSQRASRSDVA